MKRKPTRNSAIRRPSRKPKKTAAFRALEDNRDALMEQNKGLIRSQVELETSRERYVELYDSAPVAFITMDPKGNLKNVNPPGEKLLGGRQSLLVGRPFARFLAGSCRRKFLGHLARCAKGERGVLTFSIELQLARTGPAGPVYIELISLPRTDRTGHRIYHCIFIDITERKRARDQLKQAHDELAKANRAKDEFLAALSHELRTPLNPILLIASDAARDVELPPRIRAWFDSIRKNVELEARLIDDLLDLTRITSGKLALAHSPVHSHALLAETLQMLAQDIQAKGIAVEQEFKAGSDLIMGDAARVQQIFWNVLKNAIKFTPLDGKVAVQTRIADGKIEIKVVDNGIGMTGQEIANIFEAFSQGEHARAGSAHQFGGLGLGLAISRKLVEYHAGTISAASAGRGHGATFTVTFPLCESVRMEPWARPNASGPADPSFQPRLNILLVEDHAPTRAALAQLLARRNHKVETAGSVREAEQLAGEREFDVLISDIGLPDGSGYQLAHDLHKKSGIKSIALTGYGMEEDVDRSEKEGFLLHLTKPVSISALESALMAVTAR